MNKQNKGFTLVELLVVIGILGILMAALFPAISSAMLSANTSAMASNGRNLFQGITQANLDMKDDTVWPKNKTSPEESDGDDLTCKTYQSADEYFNDLFDMQNYGKQGWNPYVSVDLKFLSGSGVPTYKGGQTLKGCIAWKIATDIKADSMPDVLPVLVSRNLSTEKFARSGTTETRSDRERLTAGKDFSEPFGDKAVVIVHKGGGATVHKGRQMTMADIYEKQTITFTQDAEIEYIEPSRGK